MFIAAIALIFSIVAAPPSPAPPVVRQVLPSGVRLIVSPRPAARLVAIEIRVRGAGSARETPEENGLAHAVEHMLFKGTSAKMPGAFDGEFERMGGEAMAQTLREGTAFRVSVFPERWKDAVGLWGEFMKAPAFRETDWASERPVILREMNVARSETAKLGLQTLSTVVYPSGDPYGQPLMGSPANVERFTADDLRAYHAKRYTPANLIISVSGPVTAEEVGNVVSGLWPASAVEGQAPAASPGGSDSDTDWVRPPVQSAAATPTPPEPAAATAVDSPARAPLFIDSEQTSRDLATVYLGFRAPRLQTDPNGAAACDVLAAMLARGRGGILGDRLAADRKLTAIAMNAEYMPQTGRALFVLHATGAKRDIGRIEDVIVEELAALKARLQAQEIDLDDLLDAAKSAAIADVRSSRQTVDGEAKYLAYLDMLDAPEGYADKYAERVQAVTLADLTRLMEYHVAPAKRSVTVIGLSALGGVTEVAPVQGEEEAAN